MPAEVSAHVGSGTPRLALSGEGRWLLAAGFHFGYAAGWGAAYALAQRARPVRQRPPWLTGGLLGVLIYIAAFSRIGGGTQVRSERPPERRDRREWVVQWTAALSFALSLAYGHRALRGE